MVVEFFFVGMSGVLITTLSGAVVEANEKACALFGQTKSKVEGMLFGDLFPSPYRVSMTSNDSIWLTYDRNCTVAETSASSPCCVLLWKVRYVCVFAFFRFHFCSTVLQRSDETMSLIEVEMCEAVRGGDTVLIINLKEYIPTRASLLVSLDGFISDASNVDAFGYQPAELIGKNVSIFLSGGQYCSMPNGSVTEHLICPRSSEPILCVAKTLTLEAATLLELESINQKLLEVVFLLDEDGTIRDCSSYSVERLTGYAREKLLDMSINVLVPYLFPAVPIGVKFCCQATHKDGRSFCASLVLHESSTGQLCCQMCRLLTDAFAKLNRPTLEIPDVTLGALLGVGAFSVVRLGKVNLNGNLKIAAVKIIAKKEASMARREAEVMKSLAHDSIPKLHFTLQTSSCFILSMEFCSGVELGHYVMLKGSALISEAEAKHYFRQLVAAVAYIHGCGIIHRDIKLENIIIQANACWKKNRLKLIDFGLSGRFQPGVMQTTFCGTAAYASPEILSRKPYQGPEGDVWAMGVVLYGMLRGKFPFLSTQEVRFMAVDVAGIQSVSAADLVSCMLAKDLEGRISVPRILLHPWARENSNVRFVDCVVLDGSIVCERKSRDRSEVEKEKKRLLSDSSGSTDGEPRLPKQPCKGEQ